MSAAEDRDVPLEGVVNCRDFGGMRAGSGRVRRGLLFRSGSLHTASAADCARLTDELGIRLILDLRSSRELDLDGAGPFAAGRVVHRQVSLLENAADTPRSFDLVDSYLEMLEHGRAGLARILESLAAADSAAILHCFAGKDRTGVAVAVVLGALGVSDEDIVADYTRTTPHLPAIRESLDASRAFAEFHERFPPETLLAEPATMERLLAEVARRFGGLRAYARETGVAPSTLDALAVRLLER